MGVVDGSSSVRQERQDVRGRSVVAAGALLLVIGLIAVAVMGWLLRTWQGPAEAREAVGLEVVRYVGRVEQTRIEDVARGQLLHAAARRNLQEWAWVEENRVARIPIEQAMQELARRADAGTLVWPASKQPPSNSPEEENELEQEGR